MLQKIKNIYHLGVAILANILYGFPSRKLRIIGITGTDGKTTTTSLIYDILNTAGFNASMVTSVGAVIGGKKYDVGFHVTTPSAFAIQRFFKKAVQSLDRGPVKSLPPANAPSTGSVRVVGSPSSFATPLHESNFLVLEVTSHALDQHRVFGVDFEVGVLTNVTHEHLDYHKTYENYVKTKAKLLKMAKAAILNKDDESYALLNSKFIQSGVKGQKIITYGMQDDSDINPKKFPFRSNLIGEFNQYNILAAIGVCKALGISDNAIKKGIKSFTAPIGREDIVYEKDFTVMIDFAHTPNAFEQILSSIRKTTRGRIIHVFGSAGLRDRTKRPLMGRISSKYSDIIVLTAEDPRTETIENIDKDIESGINHFKLNERKDYQNNKQRKIYFKINDRIEAINFAVSIAKKGDLVIITGKSHEKSMNYGNGEVEWDEYKVLRGALKQLNN